MPQMAPMNWLILFIMLTILLFFMMNLIFFMFIKTKKNFKSLNLLMKKKNYNKLI